MSPPLPGERDVEVVQDVQRGQFELGRIGDQAHDGNLGARPHESLLCVDPAQVRRQGGALDRSRFRQGPPQCEPRADQHPKAKMQLTPQLPPKCLTCQALARYVSRVAATPPTFQDF